MPPQNAIDVERLVKRFGTFAAVDGLGHHIDRLVDRATRDLHVRARVSAGNDAGNSPQTSQVCFTTLRRRAPETASNRCRSGGLA